MSGSKTFTERYGALFQKKIFPQQQNQNKLEKPYPEQQQDKCRLVQHKQVELKQAFPSRQESEEEMAKLVNKDDRLREYQQSAVKKILHSWETGQQNIMLQMPTGTGKTRLFVALLNILTENGTESFKIKGKPECLIVTHREELVDQISDTLISHYHLRHMILGRDKTVTLDENHKVKDTLHKANETEAISVSSIQYLSRQLKDNTSYMQNLHFDFIIIDEAHHSLAESYKLLWKAYPEAYKLGVTATPYRLKGQGFTELYDTLIESMKVPEFIEQGYLADYRFFTVSRKQAALQKVNRLTKFNAGGDYQVKDLQEIYANNKEIEFLYECYKKHAEGKKGIIYAVNQLHAEMIAGCFTAHGLNIANIDSKTAKGRRRELIEQFRNGSLQVLVNVELFGEGFDCPAIEFAMIARPTKSLAMYLQQVGRALRPTPTGNKVIILDCVGLYNRFGLPEKERNWNYFFSRQKKGRGEFAAPLGLETDSEGMVEIDTPREVAVKNEILSRKQAALEVYRTVDGFWGIRNGLGQSVVAPLYKWLYKAKDGWFYGKDTKGNTVLFDCKANMVFKRKDCEVKLRKDHRFMLSMVSADGIRFEIGPFDKRMCIEPKYLEMFEAEYFTVYKTYDSLTMYYQRDNYVAMTSFRLSLETMFFRKTATLPHGIVLLDFDLAAYTVSNGKIIPVIITKSELDRVMQASAAWGKKNRAIMGNL